MKFTVLYCIALWVFSNLNGQQLLTDHPADDRYPNYSPDGKTIAFESNRDGNWEIYTMTSEGKQLTRFTQDVGEDRRPSWHPNGKHILFESNRSGSFAIYILCVKTPKSKPLYGDPSRHDLQYARFSPDGKHITFSQKTGAPETPIFNIYSIHKSGRKLMQLTFDTTRSLGADWSSDGSQIVFFSRRDTKNADDELYTLTISNGAVNRITEWPTHNFSPSWSPDNRHIVCATSMTDTRPELYLVDVISKTYDRLTFNDYGDTEPDWAPNGKRIVYACQENGNYDICVMEIPEKKR